MRDVMKVRSWLGRVQITPITVLATVAVLLAAGGGAYAATSATHSAATVNGPNSGAVHGTITRGTGFIAAAAVVNTNGTLARGLNATHSSYLGFNNDGGEYQVFFNRKVNRCAFVATLGNSGAGIPPNGHIAVANRSGHKNGVFVQEGEGVVGGFHLVVVC
jgi:hypothetical protein